MHRLLNGKSGNYRYWIGAIGSAISEIIIGTESVLLTVIKLN